MKSRIVIEARVAQVDAGDPIHAEDGLLSVQLGTGSMDVELLLSVRAAEEVAAVILKGIACVERREMEARLRRTRMNLDLIRAHGPPLTDAEVAKRASRWENMHTDARMDEGLRRLSRDMQEAEGGYVPPEEEVK